MPQISIEKLNYSLYWLQYYHMPEDHFVATLKAKKELAPLIYLITFKLNSPIQFKAGQYITLKIPAGEEVFDRPFSIASPPSQNTSFELLVKLIPGGVASTFFENALPGAAIEVSGPGGAFHIKNTNRPLHFIASSTGIAPFRAMMYDLLVAKKFSSPLTLTFIISPQEGIFLKEELDALKNKSKKFSFRIVEDTVSFIPTLVIAPDEDIYICGGYNFVQDTAQFLIKRGAHPHRIHFEKFI